MPLDYDHRRKPEEQSLVARREAEPYEDLQPTHTPEDLERFRARLPEVQRQAEAEYRRHRAAYLSEPPIPRRQGEAVAEKPPPPKIVIHPDPGPAPGEPQSVSLGESGTALNVEVRAGDDPGEAAEGRMEDRAPARGWLDGGSAGELRSRERAAPMRIAQAYRAGLSAEQTAQAVGEAEAQTGRPVLEAVLTYLGRAEGLKNSLLEAYHGADARWGQGAEGIYAHDFLVQRQGTGEGVRDRQRSAPAPEAPQTRPVNKPGLVFVNEANLRQAPDTRSRLVATLGFNDRVFVVAEAPGDWYEVIAGGRSGYVAKRWVKTDLPDPGSRLHRVQGGQTALGIAGLYYEEAVAPGQDLRFYVNVLAHVNPKALVGDPSNWRGVGFVGGNLIWVPGMAFAQTLKGVVGDGSITNGLWAKAQNTLGHLEDVIASVMESPQFLPEVLGELVEVVKEHWPEIVVTTAALIAAELASGALAALPDPTLVSKFLAMALQAAIVTVAGVGFVVSLDQAVRQGQAWVSTAWAANGDPQKRAEASKAFLRMVGSLIGALLAAAGVRGSWGKLAKYSRIRVPPRFQVQGEVVTPEGVRIPLNQAVRQEPVPGPAGAAVPELPPLVARLSQAQRQALLRLTGNSARQLEGLLAKVPDPLELKAMLLKIGKHENLTYLLGKFPVSKVRDALSEINPRSISPEFAGRLVELKITYPVPTKNVSTVEMLEILRLNPDLTYKGKIPKEIEDLSPAGRKLNDEARVKYQALLEDILRREPYVYRYTTRETAEYYLRQGKIERPGFMTNLFTENASDAAYNAQIKPQWYSQNRDGTLLDGVPEVVIRIPRSELVEPTVPTPSGNTTGLAGFELTTSAYPEAGLGGALQFMGKTNSISKDWIIVLRRTLVGG